MNEELDHSAKSRRLSADIPIVVGQKLADIPIVGQSLPVFRLSAKSRPKVGRYSDCRAKSRPKVVDCRSHGCCRLQLYARCELRQRRESWYLQRKLHRISNPVSRIRDEWGGG